MREESKALALASEREEPFWERSILKNNYAVEEGAVFQRSRNGIAEDDGGIQRGRGELCGRGFVRGIGSDDSNGKHKRSLGLIINLYHKRE